MAATATGALGVQVITASSELDAYNLALGQFDTDGKLDVAFVVASPESEAIAKLFRTPGARAMSFSSDRKSVV